MLQNVDGLTTVMHELAPDISPRHSGGRSADGIRTHRRAACPRRPDPTSRPKAVL